MSNRLNIVWAGLAGLTLLLAGCTMAPQYVRPEMPISQQYPVQSPSPEEDLPAWNSFFQDENLARLITIALENNRDLRIALLNIEKIRASYQIQRADLLPTISADASVNSQHLPADLSSSGEKGHTRQYSASLGFSAFELDLFGRIRSLTEMSLQSFYATEQDGKTAQISLLAEVAASYLQLVADREIYDLTKSTYESRKAQLNLIEQKFDLGISSKLDVYQARTSMEEAAVNLASYATMVSQDENYLTLLLGAGIPEDLPQVRRLSEVKDFADVPAGLPSELLERRPDIMAAEHRLQAANANIGAARANFFPRISLTGAFGKMSSEMNSLFDGSQRAWSFLPQVSLPLFDSGRNIALLESAEAERDISVATYEKSIQSAFREVADALVQRENIGDQLAAQQSLVDSTGASFSLASERYSIGISDYLNVLDAQRSLYSAESAMVSTRLLREINALNLYKALGGGWY